jgi:hypothetical protein
MQEGNNIYENGEVERPVSVSFEDTETSMKERYESLLKINNDLTKRVNELELLNENMLIDFNRNVIQLDQSKSETKQMTNRYIKKLENPVKVILNDDVFWFTKHYSDKLFYKYKNKQGEGGALLKFKVGESNITESGDELNCFFHKYSFGEIVSVECSESIHPHCRLEAIVVFETQTEVELVTNDNYVDLCPDFFFSMKKESVVPLQRRVIAFEYFHVFQMSYFSTRDKLH